MARQSLFNIIGGSHAQWLIGLFALMTVFAVDAPQAAAQVPCRYEVSHIIQGPFLPGWGYPLTVGTGISPSGRYVCGYYKYLIDNYAFVYDTTTAQFTTLPFTASSFTSANDVNEQYVVGQADGLGFVYHIATGQSTLLQPGVSQTVGTCTVNAISSSNVVCGTRTIQASPTRTTAFRWSVATGFEDLGLIEGQSTSGWGISESGSIAGYIGQNIQLSTTRAFRWGSENLEIIPAVPNGINSRSRGIGVDGRALVLGHLTPELQSVQRAFVYHMGEFRELGVPLGCDRTYSDEMNSSGVAVGGCNDLETATWRGVVWYGSTGRVLNDMTDERLGLYVRVAIDISNDGLIAAEVYDELGETFSVVLSPVARMNGDTNCDERVGVRDLLNVINAWGPCSGCDEDLNNDQRVNVQDLLQVIFNWTPIQLGQPS